MSRSGLRLQLWSCNFAPEPTGIGPISALWAEQMVASGHEVEVFAAHPHYPEPSGAPRLLPSRTREAGLGVLRLPIWTGRETPRARLRQELSYAATQTLALPFTARADVIVSVTPSFPALIPALARTTLGGTPWILWVQDLLPDGALATGQLRRGRGSAAARRLELLAYSRAAAIVVPSVKFAERIGELGVDRSKISMIHNPATRTRGSSSARDPNRILSIGNIGHAQGIAAAVDAFESASGPPFEALRWRIAGTGVAAEDVRRRISDPRIEMLGLLDPGELDREFELAGLGLISADPDVTEFNFPSRLATFLAAGMPVVAFVPPESAIAELIRTTGCGWVADARDPGALASALAEAIGDAGELRRRGERGRRFADAELSAASLRSRFDALVRRVAAASGDRHRP